MLKRAGCVVVLLVVLFVLGTLLLGSPSVPPGARAAVEQAIRQVGEKEPAFAIVRAEKATRTIAGVAEPVHFVPGGVNWPAGIYAPNLDVVQDNWCLILDRPAAAGAPATHWLAQERNGAWYAASVPDANRLLFQYFGCSRW